MTEYYLKTLLCCLSAVGCVSPRDEVVPLAVPSAPPEAPAPVTETNVVYLTISRAGEFDYEMNGWYVLSWDGTNWTGENHQGNGIVATLSRREYRDRVILDLIIRRDGKEFLHHMWDDDVPGTWVRIGNGLTNRDVSYQTSVSIGASMASVNRSEG